MADIQFTDKKNDYLLKFDISCDVSLVNAVRRTIESDVETIGFNTEPYEDSDVDIIENTSSIHNEMLMHRIGLVPPNVVDVDGFDPTRYKFILEKQNTGSKIINITSKDIKIIDNNTNTEVDNSVFFKSDPITNDHILIIKLKPNPDGNGEKVNIVAKGSRGNGAQNARFSPTSAVMYVNQIDPTKVDTAMTKYISEAQESAGDEPVDTEQLKRRFMIAESERHFMTDENDEPNVFDFTIESVEIMPSTKILDLACAKLVEKLGMVKTEIVKAINGEESAIQIADALTVMEARDITFPEETHTLGYLLQDALLRIVPKTDLLFVGYQNPHPLEKKIVVRVSLANNTPDNLRDKLTFVIDTLIAEYNKIRSALKSQFGEL